MSERLYPYEPESEATPTLGALRVTLERHNRQVLGLTALTMLAAGGLWFVLYAVLYWLILLFSSAARGLEARPPELFGALFCYGGAVLVILTAVLDYFFPVHGLRDKKTLWEIGLEFVLLIPRITLSITANLSAWQGLKEEEVEMAAALLDRLRVERRLALSHLGQDIPERSVRRQIIEALYVMGLIELRRKEDGLWLSITRTAESGDFALEPRF